MKLITKGDAFYSTSKYLFMVYLVLTYQFMIYQYFFIPIANVMPFKLSRLTVILEIMNSILNKDFFFLQLMTNS